MESTVDTATAVTPEPIFQIASGFMAAKHLFVACELGLFEALASGPASSERLAMRLDLDPERLRVVADANVALGFIERRNGSYANSPVAQAFLSGQTPEDLRPLLRFWNRLSYPMWSRMEQSVRSGRGHAPDFTALDTETQRVFSDGVEAITRPTAVALSNSYDFGRHRRVLDVGGGTGSFLQAIAALHTDLELTLFELPGAAAVARERLAGQSIEVVAGDVFQDPLPAGQDAAILANVAHIFSEEQNLDVLHRVRRALVPGGRVLLVDFWLDDERVSPPLGALISGEFLMISGSGRSYALSEATQWMQHAGFSFVEVIPLNGPQSLIVGEKV